MFPTLIWFLFNLREGNLTDICSLSLSNLIICEDIRIICEGIRISVKVYRISVKVYSYFIVSFENPTPKFH